VAKYETPSVGIAGTSEDVLFALQVRVELWDWLR
jgi:hypothetical protein